MVELARKIGVAMGGIWSVVKGSKRRNTAHTGSVPIESYMLSQ